MNKVFHCLMAGLALLAARAGAGQNWTIHEWGTFTSLQDESGRAIGGINTDDEPVPPFVHELNAFALIRPTEMPTFFFQGAPSCHPDVTMRLETPVIYFHPAPSALGTETADVTVKFHGGWLTEFYPEAQPEAPGLSTTNWSVFGHITSGTDSTLAWKGLAVGGNWQLTDTTAHVWTSPRAVTADLVRSTNGEAEKFLFYRGVAHIDAPLSISRESGQLVFRGQLENVPVDRPLIIHSPMLVDIHRDGRIAFRPLPSLTLDPNPAKVLATTAASFDAADYSAANFAILKTSLKATLVAEGLFDDEAQALLNTWELSYFKSPGLRVFFIVPREWTDYYLPLQISLPADIHRVMVGRIELVTPDDRARLSALAGFSPGLIRSEAFEMVSNFYEPFYNSNTNHPLSRAEAEKKARDVQALPQVESGQQPLSKLVSVPRTYQTYLDLGRFRNALVLEAAWNRPGLTNFIATYRLGAYHPR